MAASLTTRPRPLVVLAALLALTSADDADDSCLLLYYWWVLTFGTVMAVLLALDLREQAAFQCCMTALLVSGAKQTARFNAAVTYASLVVVAVVLLVI